MEYVMERNIVGHLLKERYNKIKKELKKCKNGSVEKLHGKLELIEDLYEYFGYGDELNEREPTPDEIMIQRYKLVH